LYREDLCPLCKRELGEDSNWNEHHLVPKCKKGKITVDLHKVCHNKIHSVFTEKQLEKYYHTIERILENEEIQKFVKWIFKKPVEFYVKHKKKR
jgi:hypothetical protein